MNLGVGETTKDLFGTKQDGFAMPLWHTQRTPPNRERAKDLEESKHLPSHCTWTLPDLVFTLQSSGDNLSTHSKQHTQDRS